VCSRSLYLNGQNVVENSAFIHHQQIDVVSFTVVDNDCGSQFRYHGQYSRKTRTSLGAGTFFVVALLIVDIDQEPPEMTVKSHRVSHVSDYVTCFKELQPLYGLYTMFTFHITRWR
jgi:hypothetical protein